MTTSPTAGQHWEQPNFEAEEQLRYVSGPVLLPAVTQVGIPAPGPEEQRLKAVRALMWPMAILICIVTGTWWPMLIIPIFVGAIVRNRIRELRRERYAAAQLMR